MKKLLLLLFLTANNIVAIGQQVVPAPGLKTTQYYNQDYEELFSGDGAHYRVETTYRDSLGGAIQREYLANGVLREVRFYANVRQKMLHGPLTSWYESGKMHTKQDYIAGKRQGQLLVYYPDGKLRRRDVYVDDARTSGECFGPDGQPEAYFEYETMPVYKGGQEGILRDIAQRLHYPVDALQRQITGKVFVKFVVTKTGTVDKVRVFKGVTPTLDAEAVRVVKTLRNFVPGRRDGEPVEVKYTLPITFSITN